MSSCNSVQEDKSTIDSLLLKADYILYSNSPKSLTYALQASIIAENINDSKRKVEAYYYIAHNLNILEEYEKSLIYIEKGLKEKASKGNKLLKARFLALKGFQYSRLHLYKQQAKQHQDVLNLTMSNQSPESIMMAARSLASIGSSSTLTGNYKSAHDYCSKGINHAKRIPEKTYKNLKTIYKVKTELFYLKAMMYIEQANTTKALPFIKMAFSQAKADTKPLALFLELYGDYYAQMGDPEKAISFYLDAVADKQKRVWSRSTSADLYLKISMSYNRNKQYEEEEKYLKLSAAERLIDENKNRRRIQAMLDSIEKEENVREKKENRFKLLFGISSSTLFFLLLWKDRQLRLKQRKLISAKESEIEEKKQLIETLELKVNESFSEVIELAKKNSPLFWARFQEVHPKFLKRMLCIDANFKSSELILSAYLYLGFATKEIADYTCKAIKTVENNRYNLRKKLGLSPEEDLILWLRNKVDDNLTTVS
jgi:tetratricopeptide (TPR) repeat protein